MRRLLLTACLLTLTLMIPGSVRAGGLFMPAHGVRALGRGGAFTAGGDDPGGIWYNPANMAGLEGVQVLVDSSLVFLTYDYWRVDSGGNVLPEVSNQGDITPIPTIGITTAVWRDRLHLGLSFSAPYSPLPEYPSPNYGPCADINNPSNCIDTAHEDAPQRYSLISMSGTMFLQLDLAAAFQIIPQLVVGISLQNMFGSFVATNAITTYNGSLSSGPEDPEYDALSQIHLVDLFNPSAKIGVLVLPTPNLRLGASLQLPYWIGGDKARIKVQLPAAPLYEKSWVEGEHAAMSVTLPLTVRLGAEWRPTPDLRVEVGFDWEHWSVLEALVIKPLNIYMFNIPSIDRYKVPEQTITIKYRDSFAARIGGEYFFTALPLILRAGYIFEYGAVKKEYASVLAMDSNKHLLSVGVGYVIGGYRLDFVYAHQFMPEREVDFRETRSPQINPINPKAAKNVGGGKYSGFIDVIGMGVTKAF